MEFIDDDGNIVVPKSVRPIIELKETVIGGKKGARRQFRYGNLHIRDYDSHYTIHTDRVDPLRNPLGHLVIDAPEYIAGAAAAAFAARRMGRAVYENGVKQGKTKRDAAIDAAVAGYIAGSAAARFAHDATNAWKKKRRS